VPEEPSQGPAAPVATEPVADGESPAAGPRVLTDADMPPIESLTENSDYSVFLSPGVSEELRRAALRKLFRLPMFSTCGELDGEYYDCRGYLPLGDTITHEMRAAAAAPSLARGPRLDPIGAELERQGEELKARALDAALAEGKKAKEPVMDPSRTQPPPQPFPVQGEGEGGGAAAGISSGMPRGADE
jgi:hypothetical protein